MNTQHVYELPLPGWVTTNNPARQTSAAVPCLIVAARVGSTTAEYLVHCEGKDDVWVPSRRVELVPR